jgi:hypothetical protein
MSTQAAFLLEWGQTGVRPRQSADRVLTPI